MSLKFMAGQGVKINSILIVGLFLLALLLLPAQAQGSVIDLELGGEGAISWEISNIKPGDSGIKTIELHNNGSIDGFVSIWISDINESDYGGDGASLDDYLLLNLSSERMQTNMSFPSTIYEFPQNAYDLKYINIADLDSGEVNNLDFAWEFQMTETSQNDAQGDELSFTINFMLEGSPSSEKEGHNSYDDDPRLNVTTPAEPDIPEEIHSDESNDSFYQDLIQIEQLEPLFTIDKSIDNRDHWTSFIDNDGSYITYIASATLISGAILLLLVKRRKKKKPF